MGDLTEELRKEVCKVVARWDIVHNDVTVFDMLPDVVMSNISVVENHRR